MKSLQVCGTSGSGKTTLVRELLRRSHAEPMIMSDNGKKPVIYEGEYGSKHTPIYVLGSYETTCGGCDTIPSVSKVAELLQYLDDEHEREGICVFEGLMISHMIGTVGARQKELGVDRHWRAYLDTPLLTCLENVQKRRSERGVTKPFNPTNTQKDWPRVVQSKHNWKMQGGTAVELRYEYAEDDFFSAMEELADV